MRGLTFSVLTMVLLVFVMLIGCSQQQDSSTLVTAQGASHNDSKVEEQPSQRTETTMQENPHRIVSTTVSITQILDELELELVGIPTSVKELPKRYEGVTKVGNPMSPDMELVKMLQPTEVLSVTTLEYDLKPVFEEAGIEATFLNLTSMQSMNKAISDLGERYNRQAQADKLIKRFKDKVDLMEQQTAELQKPTVLILMGIPGSYLVATEHSYIGDLVKLAGGINVVQGEGVEFLASNTEYLFQSNPDVILRAAHGMPEEVIKMFDEEFKKNDIWKHFAAVKNNRVYDLEEELFGTTGNILAIEAIDALLPMLYPGLLQK